MISCKINGSSRTREQLGPVRKLVYDRTSRPDCSTLGLRMDENSPLPISDDALSRMCAKVATPRRLVFECNA